MLENCVENCICKSCNVYLTISLSCNANIFCLKNVLLNLDSGTEAQLNSNFEFSFPGLNVWRVRKCFMNTAFVSQYSTPASSAMSTICKEDKFTVMTSRSTADFEGWIHHHQTRSSREKHLNKYEPHKIFQRNVMRNITTRILEIYGKLSKIFYIVPVDGFHLWGWRRRQWRFAFMNHLFIAKNESWNWNMKKMEYLETSTTVITYKSFHVTQTWIVVGFSAGHIPK